MSALGALQFAEYSLTNNSHHRLLAFRLFAKNERPIIHQNLPTRSPFIFAALCNSVTTLSSQLAVGHDQCSTRFSDSLRRPSLRQASVLSLFEATATNFEARPTGQKPSLLYSQKLRAQFKMKSPAFLPSHSGRPFFAPSRRHLSPRRRPHPAPANLTMVDAQTPKVSPVPTKTAPSDQSDILELTWDNVEIVLDEMRPYLMSDGGNVSIADIDGATVKLQLEGACGSCPSSTMTMEMGLERRLREKIPEIEQVIQAEPEGPPLTPEGIEKTLDEVRPFLNVAGGTIELTELFADSAVPTARLKMTGSGAAINSVKVEITHRLKRNWVKLANVVFE